MWIIFVVTRYTLLEAGTPHVISCPRRVVADWSAGRARFDKRMSGAVDRDQARRHETMVVGAIPLWEQLKAALPGLPHHHRRALTFSACFRGEVRALVQRRRRSPHLTQ